jgi:hypothetical protein
VTCGSVKRVMIAHSLDDLTCALAPSRNSTGGAQMIPGMGLSRMAGGQVTPYGGSIAGLLYYS